MKIKITDILLTGWNARKVKKTAPKVKELAANIQATGLIQPITVRAHPEKDGKFQLVCGERRWVAHHIAKLEHIEAILKELTDEQVKSIMFSENAEREDLDPFEESNAISLLLGDSDVFDPRAVAAELGWSKTKVLRRRKLKDLIPELREIAQNNQWAIAMCEHFAAFDTDFQKSCTDGWRIERIDCLEEARELTNSRLQSLSTAPFDITAVFDRLPVCGGCSTRTGCEPELFDDTKKEQKDDRCLNRMCWNAKVEASVMAQIKANPKLYQIVSLLTTTEREACDEGFPNALKYSQYDLVNSKAKPNAIHVAGSRAGQMVRIKLIKDEKVEEKASKQEVKKKASEMTQAEAKAKLVENRKKRVGLLHKVAAEAFKDHVISIACDSSKAKVMCGNDNEPGLIALAFVLGANLAPQAHEYMDKVKPMDLYTETFSNRTLKYENNGRSDKNICAYLVDSIAYGVLARIKFRTGAEAEARIGYHTQIAQFLNLDYETFVEFAKHQQKEEPKTWDALKVIAKES